MRTVAGVAVLAACAATVAKRSWRQIWTLIAPLPVRICTVGPPQGTNTKV